MSDGQYAWYFADSDDAERWSGPHASRGDAIAAGRAEFDAAAFSICEADKMALSFDCFDAEIVLEGFDDRNEDAWSEDGAEINARPEHRRDLERRLGDVLRGWMTQYALVPHVHSFGDMRVVERIEPAVRP